jgi:PAS domain S-box-containing protein
VVDLDPALLERLFEHNLDAVLIVEADGTLQLANPAAERALGRRSTELRDRSIREMVPEDQVDVWLELIRRPVSVPPDLGLCLQNAGGHRVPVELTILWADSGGPRALLARDLRDAQALQRELDAARLQLSEDKEHFVLVALAGAAAHELNQPLTSVMGYAELLRRRVPDGDAMAEILDVILSESERMAGLVRKIGRVSKFETKSYLLGSRIVDLDRAGEERKKP